MATTTSVVSVGAFVKVAPGRLKCWRLELIALRDRSDTIDDPNVQQVQELMSIRPQNHQIQAASCDSFQNQARMLFACF